MASIMDLTRDRSIAVRNWSSPVIHSTDRCPRCGGLMVNEWGADLVGNAGQRCVVCGELIDPVILENRRLQQAGLSSLDAK
jgi:hypothetical protein